MASLNRDNFHPKERDNKYIHTAEGIRVYIAGDTDINKVKKRIKR